MCLALVCVIRSTPLPFEQVSKPLSDAEPLNQTKYPLTHIDTWVFDLDNTLYPASSQLFAQIDRRMTTFVSDLLALDADQAKALQKQLFHEYGTTLSGLMRSHAVNPADFLDYVHDIDLSGLTPDPGLADQLAALPGRRIIYTNGSVNHAQRITARLGIDHLFHGIQDIVAADYEPKPSRVAFERFLKDHGIVARSAVFFDDMPHNLLPAHELGLTTVWIDQPSDWSRPGGEGDHVHHRVQTLSEFLTSLDIGRN